MAQKPLVFILNPAPGSASRTTRNRAERFVDAGLAAWHGRAIKMLHEPTPPAQLLRDTMGAYDGLHRVLLLPELRGLPVCRPQMALWGKDMRQA